MTPVNEEPDDVVQHRTSGRQQPLQSNPSHRQRTGSLPKRSPTEPEGAAMTRSPTRNLLKAASSLLTPDKKVGPAPSVLDSLRSILFSSCVCAFYGAAVALADRLVVSRVERIIGLHPSISAYPEFPWLWPCTDYLLVGPQFCNEGRTYSYFRL